MHGPNYIEQLEPDDSLAQWETMRDLLWANGLQQVYWHRLAREWRQIGQLRKENERLKRALHKAKWVDKPAAWKQGYESGLKRHADGASNVK